MAHLPTLPDPLPQRSPRGQTAAAPNNSQLSVSELSKLLGEHGAGSSSEDLALDLLLHDIVSQACSTTNAAGAAIALKRDDHFICRATCGECAPELGSHLSADTGLSGACIQSGEVQHCDDTELDVRVDAAACRRLGVRSVIVIPILQAKAVAGILEVFSPHAHAFTNDDIKTLIALSQSAMQTISSPLEREKDVVTATESFEVDQPAITSHRDPWTTVLAFLIMALALLLGWMLGHRGLGKDVKEEQSRSARAESIKVATPENAPARPSAPDAKPELAAAKIQQSPMQNPGGLVIYDKGKPIFQIQPVPGAANSIAVKIPAEAANSLVIARVEPQYPDQARLSHIQGPVVLHVEVNERGVVQQVSAISGDPQLVSAASEAVRRWRFKPYAPEGEALNFQTQVTVDFKLP